MIKTILIILAVQACGSEEQGMSNLQNTVEHTFWEQDISHGDKKNFAIESKAYIKSDGNDINRQTSARLYLDTWFFGKKFLDKSPEGNIFDFHAIINRGKLSSYTYLRFLNKTKYSNSTNKPEVKFDILRKSISSRHKIPILSQAQASISASAGIKASVTTRFSVSSPEDFVLNGNFNPDILVEADFASKFDPKYWAKASLKGDLVLFKYKMKSVISASYDKSSRKISSLIEISENELSALVGKLRLSASFTPDRVPYIAKVFNLDLKTVTKFINQLQIKLSKKLFKLVTQNDAGWIIEKVLFDGAVIEKKTLFTGVLSEVHFLDEASDYKSCRKRAFQLIEDSKKLNELLKHLAQSEDDFDQGYLLSKKIKAQLDEAQLELKKCEELK